MPYIRPELRGLVNTYINRILIVVDMQNEKDRNSMMTYIIYSLIQKYNLYDWDYKSTPLKILEDVKLEYYRKILAPYADKKIEENGDIP